MRIISKKWVIGTNVHNQVSTFIFLYLHLLKIHSFSKQLLQSRMEWSQEILIPHDRMEWSQQITIPHNSHFSFVFGRFVFSFLLLSFWHCLHLRLSILVLVSILFVFPFVSGLAWFFLSRILSIRSSFILGSPLMFRLLIKGFIICTTSCQTKSKDLVLYTLRGFFRHQINFEFTCM